METSDVFSITILHKLAGNYSRFCTLEQLTQYMMPDSHVSVKFFGQISSQRITQAKILQALIMLEHEGYIFLDSATDESSITIKGLLKINNKILFN